jgi:hypothetical protein
VIGERLGLSEAHARVRFQRALPKRGRVLQRLRQGRLADALADAGDGDDRGACTERSDLDERGVEQSWVFSALPSRSELRLTIEWSSDLTVRKDASSIVFANATRGVRYSDPVAIDARGHSCPLDLELVEGGIELRAPAAFVAAAEFPLTVDPLASTLVIATGGELVAALPGDRQRRRALRRRLRRTVERHRR